MNSTAAAARNARLARLAKLETQLSAVAGVPVSITIRGPLAFTLSAEGNTVAELEKAKAFLNAAGRVAEWSADYDAECDLACAYLTVSAA